LRPFCITDMFRFNTNTLYLTYSQCPLPNEECLEQLRQALEPNEIVEYIIAEEKHLDGNGHLHCFLILRDRCQSRNQRLVDLTGLEGEIYHPNIQARVKSPKKCQAYCRKDGNFLTNMQFKPTSDPWSEMVELAGSGHLKEARELICLEKPRDSIIYASQINTALLAVTRGRPVNITALTMERYPDLPEWDKKKTLIIQGESGLGKTCLAKLLLPGALFCTHVDTLKSFQIGVHTGIIFDDLEFLHLPRTTQIHVTDTADARDIHCRHSNAYVPEGIPRIITTNLTHDRVLATTDPAIARRTTCWELFVFKKNLKIKEVY